MIPAHEGTSESKLEKSIRLYKEMGFSSELMLSQLVVAGHSLEVLRERFPDLPASAFPQLELIKPRALSLRPLPISDRVEPTRAGQPSTNMIAASPAGIAHWSQSQTATIRSSESTDPKSDGISFQYVPLIQCSFPHGDPGELSTFTRRNGWLELTLATNQPRTGLPYGVPARLLTIYCASEAIRNRSREIYLGESVHDFLRMLEIPITRGERGSLRVYANQLLRLIHCSISIDENVQDARGRTGLHIRQAVFAEEARLWWDEADGVGQGSSISLSQTLFESMLERSAPLSTAAVKALRKSPMDLDVYAWLVHRLYQLNKPSQIKWDQLSGQFGHGYSELRYFRRFFTDSLKRVVMVYPEAKLTINETGLLLMPSRPHISRPASKIKSSISTG